MRRLGHMLVSEMPGPGSAVKSGPGRRADRPGMEMIRMIVDPENPQPGIPEKSPQHPGIGEQMMVKHAWTAAMDPVDVRAAAGVGDPQSPARPEGSRETAHDVRRRHEMRKDIEAHDVVK